MNLINFDEYEQNQRMYGGAAGRKVGITMDGKNYMIKFPGNLKDQGMKNIQLSYSNSPVCEYLGSHIYSILGFDVHNTILGTRNNKIVVACEDFLSEGDQLYEFDKIKVTFEPRFLDSNGNETNGTGLDMYEILQTIQEHPFLKDIPNVQERFWDMFVVDAVIGNPDRNNGNWGVITKENGNKELAPIYDNGNCLNCKWDDSKFKNCLSDEKTLIAEAYKGRRCIYELNGKRINPYKLIESNQYKECTEAVNRIVPRIQESRNTIWELIDDAPAISDIQKEFYKTVIKTRCEEVLYPLYQTVTITNKVLKSDSNVKPTVKPRKIKL